MSRQTIIGFRILSMLVLVILSGAKDLKFYLGHAQGTKSEMFRFAQHDKPQLTVPW